MKEQEKQKGNKKIKQEKEKMKKLGKKEVKIIIIYKKEKGKND